MPSSPDFHDFYQANYPGMVTLVGAVLGNLTEAEDVVQEAFARAYSRWHRLGGYDLPEAWLRRVALRIAVDSGRRARRALLLRARLAAQRQAHLPGADDGIGRSDVGGALRSLPLRQRQALVLHYIADLPVEQIASECGIPSGTVKARLAAGRRRLERELCARDEAVSDAR